MSSVKCKQCEYENSVTLEACSRCGESLMTTHGAAPDVDRIKFDDEQTTLETQARNRSKWTLVGVIVALALASLGYRLLVAHQLEQTSALFIGLPAILAIIVALTPKAKSSTGMIMKVMTIALLMSGILLGEGFICILMAAPIFYLVGFVIGLSTDYARRQRDEKINKRTFSLMMLPFLLFSMEGVQDRFSFERAETVSVERIVAASAAEVEDTLSQPPRFEKVLPFYLQLGFPKPAATSGAGLHPGDRRVIKFAGGEGRPGDLILEVAESRPGFVRFRMISDASHISHWLDWKEAEVSWRQIGGRQTNVRWTLKYDRRLDPSIYFGPWERYGVRCAAGYLIDTLATPAQK